MNRQKSRDRSWTCLGQLAWVFLSLLVVLLVATLLFPPDRVVPPIPPGSSSKPIYQAQIVRPRSGLPLGGILPPGLFGVNDKLQFDSRDEGAEFSIAENQLEFRGNNWELRLRLDQSGTPSAFDQVLFDLLFEGQAIRVCGRPKTEADYQLDAIRDEAGRLSGQFVVRLTDCVNNETGKELGWPTSPLVLRGSFDCISKKDSDD